MTDESLMEDACVALARAQLREGRGQEACGTCELVLKKNPQHCGATVAYAEVARAFRKKDEELSLILRAVVMDQENRDARRGAALAISDEGGFERLRNSSPIQATRRRPRWRFWRRSARTTGGSRLLPNYSSGRRTTCRLQQATR